MPQSGQAPGLSLATSGSIGQIHLVPGGASTTGAFPPRQWSGASRNFTRHFGLQKK